HPANAERAEGAAPKRPEKVQNDGNLFDMLFGGPIRYRPVDDLPTEPKTAVAAPKITAPSYYDYKADPLVKVNFASLASLTPATPETVSPATPETVAPTGSDTTGATPEKIAFTPAPAGLSMADAVAGLTGFDLLAEKDVAQAL